MNKSDQLLEFIDGTLPGSDEQTLFESLAAEPELRTELRHYVQIGDAVRADREAFTPPADLERRLLGGLGLIPFGGAAAGAAGSTAAATGILGGTLLKGGLLPLLFGFMLGGLLVGGSVWLALEHDDGFPGLENGPQLAAIDIQEDHGFTTDASSIEYAAGVEGTGITHGVVERRKGRVARGERVESRVIERRENPAPPATAMGGERGRGGLAAKLREARRVNERLRERNSSLLAKVDNLVENVEELRKTVALLQAAPTTSPQDNGDSPLTMTSARASSHYESEPPVTEPLAERSPTTLPDVVPAEYPERSLASENRPFLGLEFRKLALNSPMVDNAALEAPSNFAQEDIVIGGYYGNGEGLQVGLEAGRERYTQSFFYNQGDSIVIEQRPLIGWGGVAARLESELFSVPVTIGGVLGASQHGGPVARGLLGVDVLGLLSDGPLRMPISLEASSLVYTFNDQYFVSGNWGLNFALQYRIGL